MLRLYVNNVRIAFRLLTVLEKLKTSFSLKIQDIKGGVYMIWVVLRAGCQFVEF